MCEGEITMATVTLEMEGKDLERVLGQLGVGATYIDGVEAPQEFRFNFSGGWYTKTAVKQAMDILNSRYGYNYEINTSGGFTVTRQKKNRQFVSCGDTVNSIKEAVANDPNGKQKCYLCFGKGADGYITTNFDEAVHILIAGTTGSGKSSLLNSFIMQILCFSTANVILIDPKNGAEFGLYEQDIHDRVEHVAKDTQDAVKWLKVAVNIMEQRYSEMSRKGLKKYDGKSIIVVIDELADLMMTSKKEVEEHIIRIAQKGRAAGIHLIVATQDPRAKVVTGLIKYNLPTKVCLKTANAQHSMNIIDVGRGAELLDKGDGLVKLPSSPDLIRAQTPFITDEEIINCLTH